jgi:serine/threonine protein kinase/WD40 repeat protein
MNDKPSRELALFAAALELPAEDRAAYLARECGDDHTLKARVEALLRADSEAGNFMEQPPGDFPAVNSNVIREKAGDHIGRYKLIEQIGEGGYGVVFMAEQEEPVHRRVALKIIKPGMDTKSVIARFEAERQALALMDHPNIAKVFDAGATESGRPFFVMELIRGIKVTDYCDQNSLSTPERLELFVQVCQAVQHAHQKGIIHRDIKPSNILVTTSEQGVAQPMVIDFGIAKATTNQRLTDKTLFTASDLLIGTPTYMSPEQAEMSGLDIDTRSDIYGLGVLLYELLTGKTPFDAQTLMSQGIDAMRKTIREQEPVRPSTRLGTLKGDELTTTAKRRSVESSKLAKLLRGDLDWIVMKCLEKDRTRRYETANGLAVDIKRHLNNEPVVARPPSKLYEFQKTVRRHKVGFATTVAIIVVLAVGVIVSTWQAVRASSAEREQNRLRIAAQEAEASESKQKAVAQQGLYNSLLGQARATRLARQLGYRDRVFALVEQAKALDVPQKSLADLRNEATACVGDFVGLTPAMFTNFSTNIETAWLAPSGKRAAFSLNDGAIQLLEMPSGKEVARFARLGADESFGQLCFNTTDDKLFALSWPKGGDGRRPRPILPVSKLYSWACDTDGHWQEATNCPLPGAVDLLNDGAEVLATILDVRPPTSEPPAASQVQIRLFNLQTGAFVPGYDLTCALTNRLLASPFGFADSKTPDGGLIALETYDTNSQSPVEVSLYDWKTNGRINQLRLPTGGILSLSPDSKYLACLAEAGGAIYTVPGLERIGQFKEFFFMSYLAPTVFWGNMAALPIYQQNRIRLWNAAAGDNIELLDEPELTVPAGFSGDGSSLMTYGSHHARFYGLNTPEKLDLPSHGAAVPGIAFSPDGRQLASVGKDRVIRVCDSMTGRILWQTNNLPGAGQCVGYSPDGRRLASGDYDTREVCVWNAHTGQSLLQLATSEAEIRTWSAQFSPDGRYLATIGLMGLMIYEVGDDAEGLKATLVKSNSVAGRQLLFAPDRRCLEFENNSDHSLAVWDFDKSPEPSNLGFVFPMGVEMASFTPDGHLAAIDEKGRIVSLEMPTGKEISSFQVRKPSDYISAGISLSPDGTKLGVTSESQRGVNIWEFKTGKLLFSLPDELGTVYWLAWSPDSRRLAIARDNGNIAIWNLDTVGQILAKLGLNP